MITEIYVEGKRLDLTADISSLLTFAIDDVKDFASRSTTFSKAVVLPGTANNNAIFGNIFDTGISNDYDPNQANVAINFNPAVSAKCLIFQDNIQTFKGTLRLIEIDFYNGRIEYEVALNGDLTTLNVALSSGYLTDLDFSEYNVVWTAANIAASWDNTPGSGVFFPLIDYGTFSQGKHNWDFRTLRPALYVKEYIDKIFAASGFRYNCDLFGTDRFKGLVIPHNQKVLLSLVSRAATAGNTAEQTVIDSQIGSTVNLAQWNNNIAGGFSYAAGVFTYTQATSLNAVFHFRLSGDRFSTTNGTFNINVRHNGVTVATKSFPTFTAHISYLWDSSVAMTLSTTDTIDIQFQYGGTGTSMVVKLDAGSYFTIDSSVPTQQPVDYNQLITINDSLPQNVRQVDFLSSIVKLFNLYVTEDQFDDRLINISPFIDFYSTDSTTVQDWTYKLNRDKPIKIKPLSELNSKLYNFNYKDDSDYWNDRYKKRYNQGYGSYIYDTEFEFATQENKLELIFAPTPLVGYEGEDKVYSTIFKRTGDIDGAGEETIDSVIRILQSKKSMGVSSWQILSEANTGTPLGSYTSYGYAGHFDDPTDPMNDLNFGALKELYYVLPDGVLSNTQFNIFWSTYMAEITSKDSKLLTANFYLTAKDIFNLNFSHYIYVDGSLFRLNKITDYNVSIPGDCEVQLLKVINTTYTYVTFPPVVDTFYWIDSDGTFITDSDGSKIKYQ